MHSSRNSFDRADAPLAGPYRFDRRGEDRWPAQGGATICCVGGPGFGVMQHLRLADSSAGGVGGRCDEAIDPGREVAITFQTPGGGVARATVVRCAPCGDGYDLGLRFAHRLAA